MEKKYILKFLLISILILFFNGCVSVKTKTELYKKDHKLKGYSSWYGKKFHNRKTASGEIYSMWKLTAAHKTLPFGTIVRVTNIKNGHSVEVKINDRGPYIKKRVIDLSYAAFKKIASPNVGVIPVYIDIIDDSNTFRYKR